MTAKLKKSFSDLGLKKDILLAIDQLGLKTPTLVQEKIIPLVLQKKDVAFTAQTGSGKTLAFTLGLLSRIQPKQNTQILIITPTRELCLQIGNELEKLGKILGFNTGIFYGGHELSGDRQMLTKKLQVIVATPGRLIQHVNFKTIKIGDVKAIVFDESDQMFDNGFYKDCSYILERASIRAQVILSSATITSKVENFLEEQIPHHELVEIGIQIPPSIKQESIFCTIKEKNDLLLNILKKQEKKSIIIFVNTKVKVNSLYDILSNQKSSKQKSLYKSEMLSSDSDQKQREKTLNNFKQKKFNILICTDVASRGLHIEDVDIVINYDVPSRNEFYIHRIGRTGRTGKKGRAISFVCPEDEENYQNIEEEYKLDIKIIKKEMYE
jgi:ATP-dependent RNA helicase DeaD